MNIEPQQMFSKRKDHFGEREQTYIYESSFFSVIRVMVFVALLILVVYFANSGEPAGIVLTILILLPAFLIVLKHHLRKQYLVNWNKTLKNINEDEIRRINLDFSNMDQGEDFVDKNHPYGTDLDLFGKSSLFQLLNRTITNYGRNSLAYLLKFRSSTEFILLQQEAVKEVAKNLDWRQEFQASGLIQKANNLDVKGVLEWKSGVNLVKSPKGLILTGWLMRSLFLISILLVIFGFVSFEWVGIPFLINLLLLVRLSKTTQKIYEKTGESYKVLKVYAALIKSAESSEFSSKRWQDLIKAFDLENSKASKKIKQLGDIINGLDARNGMMYHILNAFLLLDYHWVGKAEQWKNMYSENIHTWFEAIGEIEAITSIAGFSYANPEFVFPTIVSRSHQFKAIALGHPLIPKDKRISNDFEHAVDKQITLVTGSNMSGKSTFLRTVGINLVLALAGAPVCARQLELSNIQLFTSMRTLDNLEENISSFYAELTRIKQLLELLNQGEPVLFMLDEILKGTNSKDRHKGAVALTKQLSKSNASGFVSTHDLELSYLENQLPQVKNYSFESDIRDGDLYFDYKIKQGVTESFNASILMEKIGINMGK